MHSGGVVATVFVPVLCELTPSSDHQRVEGLGRLTAAQRMVAVSRARQRDVEIAQMVLGEDEERVRLPIVGEGGKAEKLPIYERTGAGSEAIRVWRKWRGFEVVLENPQAYLQSSSK